MRIGNLRLAGTAGLVSLGLLAMTPTTATADEFPTGSGSVGTANVEFADAQLKAKIDPLAPCSVHGQHAGETAGTTVPGFVSFGPGNTSCTLDSAGQAKVEVIGRRFMLDLKRQWNGPIIRITSYKLSCRTVPNGSSSSMTVSGVTGIQLPNPIPANHVVDIPGKQGPIARVTLNEVVLPEWQDGSMTVNLMRIQMFPATGSAPGDVVVGTVRCSPGSTDFPRG